jgi:transcriptional regulator with XRE-family HTH domain
MNPLHHHGSYFLLKGNHLSFTPSRVIVRGMAVMATNETDEILEQITSLIENACASGDNISAIAQRAGVPRAKVSRIRNQSFQEYPSIETLSKIANALGRKVTIQLLK